MITVMFANVESFSPSPVICTLLLFLQTLTLITNTYCYIPRT
jgi:hypothetical protein